MLQLWRGLGQVLGYLEEGAEGVNRVLAAVPRVLQEERQKILQALHSLIHGRRAVGETHHLAGELSITLLELRHVRVLSQQELAEGVELSVSVRHRPYAASHSHLHEDQSACERDELLLRNIKRRSSP